MKKYSALFLAIFLAFGSLPAAADQAPAAPLPASMTDEELVSYINGRLDAALKADGYNVSRLCTQSNGCDIIIE